VLISCANQTTKQNSDKPTGSHLIGGSFEMENHKGEMVNDKDFQGQYIIVFFGFSTCPTVCPVGMSTIGRTLNSLPKDMALKVQPIFVTIDPERDTPKVMAKFIKIFNKRFVGLRGTTKQTDDMVKKYRAYYGRIEKEGEGYEMEHSDIIYFMGRNGEYLSHFSSAHSVDAITKRIKSLIK
jgi:protein SCO1/2